MRTKVVLCVVAAFAMSSPAMAGIGAISFDLTSGGSDADVVLAFGAGGVIPVEISFSATSSGTSGVNRGVSNVGVRLITGLPTVDQVPMTLDAALIGARGGSTSTTLGFNALPPDPGTPINTDGDPSLDAIDAVFATQGIAPDFDFRNAMGKLKNGGTAEGVGTISGNPVNAIGAGPVTMATGGILVDPGTAPGTYILTLLPQAGQLWDTSASSALPVNGTLTGDTLTLIIVPEPATMLLLAPAALGFLRRRRKA